MKKKIGYYFEQLRTGLVRVWCDYPVETLLALCGSGLCLLCYRLEWPWVEERLPLLPLFFGGVLAVNLLAGCGPWRKVYFVGWVPIVPLACWPGIVAWFASTGGIVTFAVLVPLALLLCRLATDNDRFVADAVVWLRSGVLSVLFANVALGLFCAILYSTVYIFGLEGMWIDHLATYALILFETLVLPLLFLLMSRRWCGARILGNRVIEVLLDYIVTPALLIYTAILYLYMLRILVLWSLPEGGVAYLVFGFTIFALLIEALQTLLQKRHYDWFFDRFSLLSIPTQLLFWIGVIRRTNEYGLTEPRVFLLVCGGLMTLCVLLFLSRRTGRYLYVAAAAFVVFAAVAYVPAAEPERIAVESQMRRARRLAGSLGRLDARGRLSLAPATMADTLYKKEYRQLYESLKYVNRDSAVFARFGIEFDDYLRIFPERMRAYISWGANAVEADEHLVYDFSLPRNAAFEIDGRYPHAYTNLAYWSSDSYRYENDTLRLLLGREEPVRIIPGSELLRRQLEAIGYRPGEMPRPTDDELIKLLDYRDDKCRIIFEQIVLHRPDSVFTLSDMTLHTVFLR